MGHYMSKILKEFWSTVQNQSLILKALKGGVLILDIIVSGVILVSETPKFERVLILFPVFPQKIPKTPCSYV